MDAIQWQRASQGHGLKGQEEEARIQVQPEAGEDPAEKCFPCLCLRQEPGRGPSPPKQAQETLRDSDQVWLEPARD